MSARRMWLALGVSALAVAGGVSVVQRRAPRSLIDWERARRIAHKLADAGEPWAADAATAAAYDDLVARSLRAVAEHTGIGPLHDQRVRILDRRAWIDANLSNFRDLLAPLVSAYDSSQAGSRGAARVVSVATSFAVTGQLGVLLGFLSRRVLGQYDIPLMEPDPSRAAIYFVEPNIRAVAAQSGVDAAGLRFWVALHEATHAYQFHAVDPAWLRGYAGGLMRAYLTAAVQALEQRRELGARLSRGLRRLRTGELGDAGLLGLALTADQAQALRKIQALMTLMEGHSNHVMRAVGQQVIPEYGRLAGRLRRREHARGIGFRTLARLLGLELKLEQYRVGEAFVDRVVAARDLAFLQRAWAVTANLPTLSETRDPEAWIARMDLGAESASSA